jgi:hypothetical protein
MGNSYGDINDLMAIMKFEKRKNLFTQKLR